MQETRQERRRKAIIRRRIFFCVVSFILISLIALTVFAIGAIIKSRINNKSIIRK